MEATKVPITHRDLTAPLSGQSRSMIPVGWELKHDGYRALLVKDGERLSLRTRKGNDLLQFFPEIAADMRKVSDCAIDGALGSLCDPRPAASRKSCGIRTSQRPRLWGDLRPGSPLDWRDQQCQTASLTIACTVRRLAPVLFLSTVFRLKTAERTWALRVKSRLLMKKT